MVGYVMTDVYGALAPLLPGDDGPRDGPNAHRAGPALDPEAAGSDVEGCGISDEELTRLALSADPGLPLAPDAVPISAYLEELPSLLPAWYMPGVMAHSGSRWRKVVILSVIGAFLFIEALGLCSTFGSLGFG